MDRVIVIAPIVALRYLIEAVGNKELSRMVGILFALRSGMAWEMLPQELGCGSGITCWRRLRDWQDAGIWQLILPRTAQEN
jgi:transposase